MRLLRRHPGSAVSPQAAPPNPGHSDMDPGYTAYTQGAPGAQARTSMVITSTWTLVGRGRSGWKCLARATRRCRVASKSLLKMAGGRGVHRSEPKGPPEGPWAPYCPNNPLKTKEICLQPSGRQRAGEIYSEPQRVTLNPHLITPPCEYSPRAQSPTRTGL